MSEYLSPPCFVVFRLLRAGLRHLGNSLVHFFSVSYLRIPMLDISASGVAREWTAGTVECGSRLGKQSQTAQRHRCVFSFFFLHSKYTDPLTPSGQESISSTRRYQVTRRPNSLAWWFSARSIKVRKKALRVKNKEAFFGMFCTSYDSGTYSRLTTISCSNRPCCTLCENDCRTGLHLRGAVELP
jgi:hypothetical protein